MVYVLVLYLIFKVHFTPLLSHISRFFANFGGIFLTTQNFAHIIKHLLLGCIGIAENDFTALNADTFLMLVSVRFLLHISSPIAPAHGSVVFLQLYGRAIWVH